MNSTHIGNIDLHTAWHAARDAINPRPDGACASRLRTATIVGPSRSKKTSLARFSTLHSQVPKRRAFCRPVAAVCVKGRGRVRHNRKRRRVPQGRQIHEAVVGVHHHAQRGRSEVVCKSPDRTQPIVRRPTLVVHEDGKRHRGHARLPRCNDRRPVMMSTMATPTVHKRSTVMLRGAYRRAR